MATITTITAAGYQAALNNVPAINGYRVEIKYADVYVGKIKKGRFETKGVRIGNQQLRVRATITSSGESYSYTEVRLIDGISGVEFATIKDDKGGVLDFVSADKKSTFTTTIAMSTLPNDRVTIVQDDGNSVALAELDAHKNDVQAHKSLFDKKIDKTDFNSAISSKADKAHTVSAGNGLTGGGDLSANRTITLGTPSKITATTTNSVGTNTHTHEIDNASTTVAGVVKLNNTFDSQSQTEALTANAGRLLKNLIDTASANALPLRGEIAVGVNLDTLTAPSSVGVWHQSANARALTTLNYPAQVAGTLFVLPAVSGGTQIYILYNNNGIFTRTQTTSSGGWNAWKKMGDDKLGNSGNQTLNGTLTFNNPNTWATWYAPTKSGQWRFETHPDGDTSANGKRFNFVFTGADNSEKARIAFPDPNGTQIIAYQSWVTEQIRTAKPSNFGGIDLDTATEPQFFINAQSANPLPIGGDWGGFVIGYHNDCTQIIAAGGNLWARGSDANPITQASDWGEWKRLLDETNGVMLTGEQTISGSKTFSGSLKTTSEITSGAGITISGSNKTARFGMGTSDCFIHNPTAKKYLQLKDNGELAYSNDTIILQSMLSNAVNSASATTVASSAAVKTAYDKAQAAQTAAEQATPSGTIAFMAGSRAPAGWLKANGAAVSRTTYANLFAAIGTTYGAGDGRTTFNLPDLRGEFARGFDDGRGVDGGRGLGTWQSDAIQQLWGSIQFHEMVGGTPSDGIFRTEQTAHPRTYHNSGSGFHTKVILDASTVVRTAAETRPRNLALLACIKI